MKKAKNNKDDRQALLEKVDFFEMQVKHFQNELRLTKKEYETTANNYFDSYSNMEKIVEERT